MRSDQDTTDSTYQTMSAKIGSLGVKIGAASAFVEPEILSYSKEQLEAAEKKMSELLIMEERLKRCFADRSTH